jgi:hypothetical protein
MEGGQERVISVGNLRRVGPDNTGGIEHVRIGQ